MRLFSLFIMRPVATTLFCAALVLTGGLAFLFLPVAPLPQVDFPMISVSAKLAGASPETMASSVATPLEQSLGSIAGLSEMSSRSTEGSTRISLMFDLDRSEEHTSELQSLMRISYAVFCLKKKKTHNTTLTINNNSHSLKIHII